MSQTRVYTDNEQTALMELQRQGARLVRMRPDGKRPALKWGGWTGRCLTQRQAEYWLRIGGRFALVPYSIGFTVIDVDEGPWQDLTAVYPPQAVIPSRKLWRRHLYYSDTTPRAGKQGLWLYGCKVDVLSASKYAALWHPDAVLDALESPRQGVLFPWWEFWPEKGAQGPPQPPGNPPAPPVGEPRDGPLSDAYPLTRNNRLFEVVDLWGREHAREYSDRDRFHVAIREYAEGRALEMPDLSDFWDGRKNYPAKAAYYVGRHAWRMWRPVHSNNWRWHNNANYDLEGRDSALVALRGQGLSQEAIGVFHGITKGQVSQRLRGAGAKTQRF